MTARRAWCQRVAAAQGAVIAAVFLFRLALAWSEGGGWQRIPLALVAVVPLLCGIGAWVAARAWRVSGAWTGWCAAGRSPVLLGVWAGGTSLGWVAVAVAVALAQGAPTPWVRDEAGWRGPQGIVWVDAGRLVGWTPPGDTAPIPWRGPDGRPGDASTPSARPRPQGSTVGWTLGGALVVTPAMAALGVWVRRPGRWLALAVVERVFAATAALSAAQGGLGPLWLAGGAALLGGLAWRQGAAVDRRLPVETSEIAEASPTG